MEACLFNTGETRISFGRKPEISTSGTAVKDFLKSCDLQRPAIPLRSTHRELPFVQPRLWLSFVDLDQKIRKNAGHANNALPQSAQANVNCRILPGHSREEVRQKLIEIFADPKIVVRLDTDSFPDLKGFAPVMPPPEVLRPLERVAAEMWPGVPVIPEMETGASDSIYTIAAGIPSYGINGLAIDQDDVRAHGKDERVRVAAFYDNVEFYYRYLRALSAPQ